MGSPERRARRLLHWYPLSWRATHEDEFSMLLEDSIAERPYSPKRWLSVAIEGSHLRWADATTGAASRPAGRMPVSTYTVAAATQLFVAYGVVALTKGLDSRFDHGFETGLVPACWAVGSAIILAGIVTFLAGLGSLHRTRSLRACWPMLLLGASLSALAASDWWISSRPDLVGWLFVSNLAVSLVPSFWTYSWLGGAFQLYLVANLVLIGAIAASSMTLHLRIAHRQALPTASRHRSAVRPATAAVSAAVTVTGTWLWQAHTRNPIIHRWAAFNGAILTATALYVAAARIHRSRRPEDRTPPPEAALLDP